MPAFKLMQPVELVFDPSKLDFERLDEDGRGGESILREGDSVVRSSDQGTGSHLKD